MAKNNYDSKNIPEEFKKYISYNFGSFSVKNDKNGVLITFGRFKSEDIACAAAGLLIKYDWNIFDVANDPLYDYLGEFWVFKVINNNLIFDRKFNSFEQAVEYMEINSKCDNYHNDIFSKKKRKSKYSNTINNQVKDNNDVDIPNIYSKGNSFVVKYKFHGKEYGKFSSIDEAIVAKNLLIENNWKFSNSTEIKFYNSYYWVFKIESNVLFFIDKFESYEDALDCLDLFKGSASINKINKDNSKESIIDSEIKSNDLLHVDLENNTSKSSNNQLINKKKPKYKKKKIKKQKINKSDYPEFIPKVKHKLTRDNIKIKKIEEVNGDNFQLDIKPAFHIIQFQDNSLIDYYSIFFLNSDEIKFSSNIQKLKEIKYILKLLNVYGWNLNKINNSSSIHYIDDGYYIIKSFNGKLIISGSFHSYSEAEENIEFLYYYYSSNKLIPKDIEKHGDYYKYIGEHNGKSFEISYQKSLETLKSILDIFEYYNWNPFEFEDYNIYYYHGIYWEIDFFNYYIKLKGRFYSKEDAIKHKLS